KTSLIPLIRARRHALLLGVLLMGPSSTHAAQVQVMLFGQPCVLQGSSEGFSEAQLQAIHQASPEQAPISSDLPTLKTSLERLKNAQELPRELQKYRELRTARLEARLKFEEAVIQAHRRGDANAFSEATKPLIHARRHSGLMKKFKAAQKAGPSQKAWEDLRDYFVEFSGSDGEEDFHRVLSRLKIQYHCTFDEERGEEEPTETPKIKKN
ncbi:MAG: hypothetical protein KGQ59_03590, partial [Bdellovibrionales bacterium]|nr:hypothetical protein [Bdellovibrionales bacterium]